jgi:TonB-linked SusC/RagA family outer membrane protein
LRQRTVVRPLLIAAAVLAAVVPVAGAQNPGSITGRVTDAASGQPIVAAQVTVSGTNLATQTGADGQYTLRAVSPGSVEVRALRVGYVEMRQRVTVAEGQAATADFAMRSVPVSLAPVVTTATGEQRRNEVANSIASLDADKTVAERSISTIGDLLNSRAAGVQVIPGTQTGNGTRVRIRGTSSLSLSNNPIYIIDGVRVESATGSSSLSVGGSTIARTVDINPEEIENIEVVRGPSASTLYGTDAANGVIVITTKRGRVGRPEWTYYTEQTGIKDLNEYPDAYRAWRNGGTPATTSSASNAVQCFLTQSVALVNPCVQDSVTTFNLFKDSETTPYGLGYRQQHGVQLRGGVETIRYFLSGEWEDEDGVTKVPEFEKRYMAARNLSLSETQQSPNRLARGTARTNLNIMLPRNADIAVGVGYISQDIRLPTSDDSGVSGIGANVFGGPGFKYNLTAAGDTLFGWRQFTPKDIYQQTTNQAIERFIGSLSPNWRPTDWLAFRGNFGLDYGARHETQICRFANCPDVGADRLGFKRDNRTNMATYTVDVGGSGSRHFTADLLGTTTVGLQFYRNVFNRNGAEGNNLPPGATTVTAGGTKLADETSSESRTLGSFIEQNMAFRDRLFVTGALRADRNSAFGKNFGNAIYPKLAVSWVASDEAFFPTIGLLDQLRLRAAYGASGVQPGPTDAVPFYVPVTARTESGDASGAVISALGNANLKPERSTELELGVDGTFWDHRLNVELTRYDKSSKDALISRVLPPSIGTNATSRFENLGEVRNWGYEAMINARVLDGASFGWDVTLTGSRNSNKLESLGGVPEIVNSSTIRQVENYPLNGWWSRPILYAIDKDGNNIITYNADTALSEISVGPVPTFHGYSQPRNEVALTNGIDFWQRRFRLAAMVDYKGGHKQYFNTERIRCSNRNNCRAITDIHTPFEEQAAAVALREHPAATVAGYFKPADFIRLREVALTFNAPQRWANRARARDLTLTLAARNAGILWTRYPGVDPESQFGATADAGSDFQAAAPPSFFTLRLNLGF